VHSVVYIFITLLLSNSCALVSSQAKSNLSDVGVVVKSVDPLIKVTDDDDSDIEETSHYDVARGEKLYIQLAVFSGQGIIDVEVKPSGRVSGLTQIATEVVGNVSIASENSSIKRKVESGTKRYPDPLFPITSGEYKGGKKSAAIWLSYQVAENAVPGNYKLSFVINTTLPAKTIKKLTKEITVRVFPATLSNSNHPYFSNWLFVDNPLFGPEVQKLKFLHDRKIEPAYSKRYWQDIRLFAKFLAPTLQNSLLVSPQRLATYKYDSKTKLQIDFSRFDSMMQIFLDAGFKGRIEGWHITSRTGGWDSDFALHYIAKNKKGEPEFVTGSYLSPDADRFYRQYLPALLAHLKQKGWDQMYYQHIGDEPTDANANSYLAIGKFLKNIAPGLKTIDAIQTTKVAAFLDVPVPQLDFLKRDKDYYKKLIDSGKEMWFYTAFLPQGSYANRFIEQPGLAHQMLFWIAARYQLKGHLNWGLNAWEEQDVFENLGKKSGPFHLPAGDGWLIYPFKQTLISSIRFKLIEEGIEDYILLAQLKSRKPDVAEKIIKEVVFDFDDYENDPKSFRLKRKEILENLN
jgi:hypothetical protein